MKNIGKKTKIIVIIITLIAIIGFLYYYYSNNYIKIDFENHKIIKNDDFGILLNGNKIIPLYKQSDEYKSQLSQYEYYLTSHFNFIANDDKNIFGNKIGLGLDLYIQENNIQDTFQEYKKVLIKELGQYNFVKNNNYFWYKNNKLLGLGIEKDKQGKEKLHYILYDIRYSGYDDMEIKVCRIGICKNFLGTNYLKIN